MVPGSTLIYGSSLMLVTRMLRDSRIAAREAAAIPFPRLETTPPVTNTYLVINAKLSVKAGVYRNPPDATNRRGSGVASRRQRDLEFAAGLRAHLFDGHAGMQFLERQADRRHDFE